VDFPLNTYLFQRALNLYNNANYSLDCAVYFQNLDFISSPALGLNTSHYYSRLSNASSRSASREDWYVFLNTKYTGDFLISSHFDVDGKPNLVYADTQLKSNTYTTIFVTTPLSQLAPLLELLPEGTMFCIQSTRNQLYIMDQRGNFVTDSDISLDHSGKLLLPEHYTGLSTDYNLHGYNCHLIIPDHTITNRLQGVRTAFLLTLLLTLLLGLTSVIFLLYTNYQPLRKLLTKFNVTPANDNEFMTISSSFEKLQSDYHTTRQTLQNQNQELTNGRLLSLLKGRVNEADITSKLLPFDFNLNAPIALVGFMVSPANHDGLEYDDVLFFIIDNIFCELFQGYHFRHIEDGRFIYYLFQLSDKDGWHDTAMEKTNYLCDLLNEKWDSSVIAVVSETADYLSSCKFLYREVMEGFDQQTISGGNQVVDTRSLNSQKDEQIRDFIEQDLTAAIKEGDLKAALNVSVRIFSDEKDLPFSIQRVYAFDAFTLVLGIFNSYIINPLQQITALNHLSPIIQATETEELVHCFNQFLVYVCSEITQKWQTESKDIVLKIKEYVHANYTNQDLCVNSIANAIDRNPAYLSRVFKENTGEGLLDYINSCRINRAHELMQTDNHTLTEIAEMVGYPNARAFRRAFTKLVGELPSKYSK